MKGMRVLAYWYVDEGPEAQPDWGEWRDVITQIYCDRGVLQPHIHRPSSSIEDLERREWQQLMQDCQTHPPDYVLIRQLADLGNSAAEVQARFQQLAALNIPIALVGRSDGNPATAAQRSEPTGEGLVLPPLVVGEWLEQAQQLQTEQRRRHIRHGHARNRVKALPPPGKAPYGYRRGRYGYVIDRTTAPIVKAFFEQFLLFGSVRGAVRYIAKQYGKKISASTGQRWLMNPVYRGDLAYQNGPTIRDTHAPILSREEAAQVDRLRRRNRRLSPRSASAPRSLAGLVFCSECQSSLTVTRVTAPRRVQEYLYLRPRHCPLQPKCAAIPYDEVLQATIPQICEDLPRAIAQVHLPDTERIQQDLRQAIAAKQAILEQIPTLLQDGVLDQPSADLRTYTLRTELGVLQSQLEQLPPANLTAIAQTLSIPQFWYDLTEAERRVYFREFIRQVQIQRCETGWRLNLQFVFMPQPAEP